MGWFASAELRTVAPILSPPSPSGAILSSGRRLMSMTCAGRSTFSFMRSSSVVPPATKRVPGFAHIGVVRPAGLLEQCDRGHDLAGGAIAALVGIVLDEGRLHGMQRVGLSDAFDRGDLVALVHHGEREAGIHPLAVDVHGACAALAVVAAFLGPGEGKGFAQAIEERGARVEAQRVLPCIDAQCDGNLALLGRLGRADVVPVPGARSYFGLGHGSILSRRCSKRARRRFAGDYRRVTVVMLHSAAACLAALNGGRANHTTAISRRKVQPQSQKRSFVASM